MTSYETQALQLIRSIYNLLNAKLVPFIDAFNEFIVWIQEFFLAYCNIIYFFGFGILFVLILKWLSRW